MSSSFYPATIYAQQDAKTMVWELEKENAELRRQLTKARLVRDAYEKVLQEANKEVDALKLVVDRHTHKKLNTFIEGL